MPQDPARQAISAISVSHVCSLYQASPTLTKTAAGIAFTSNAWDNFPLRICHDSLRLSSDVLRLRAASSQDLMKT